MVKPSIVLKKALLHTNTCQTLCQVAKCFVGIFHLMLRVILESQYYYYLPITDKSNCAWRGGDLAKVAQLLESEFNVGLSDCRVHTHPLC